ncbi:MAG: ABC transporter ATP-binding protein [Oligoflexus sp.]
MIEVSGVSKRFGDVVALDQVSFRVEKGQVVGFLGANGAGKTTTMDIICGCLGTQEGYAKIAGFDVFEQPVEVKKRIGYLPDEPPIHDDMKVGEFIRYAAKLRQVPTREVDARVQEVLERLSLTEMKERLIGNLSKGFRQRVGLAQALVHKPEVLILDEPTEGLDPNQIIQIRELIRSLKQDHTILFSSHILSEVESICDELIIIHKGKVIEQGNYQHLLEKSEKSREYKLEVREGAETLLTKLQQMPGVEQPQLVGGNLLTLNTDGQQQVLDGIVRAVLDGGHGMRQLSPRSKTLEEIFIQLTH